MKRTASWALTLALVCLISTDARSADKPRTLVEGEVTALRVDEVAVLHIPADRRYLPSANGAWDDVLVLVEHSGQEMTFRAVHPGKGVIIISPDAPDGECVSCTTLHYFITVASQK